MARKPITTAALMLGAITVCACFPLQQRAAAAGLTACEIEGDRMTVRLQAGAYRIAEGEQGQQIQMEDFGYLMAPGVPMLPMRRFVVALPPGARARSVEILDHQTYVLPGQYRIAPFPGIMFLPDMPRFAEAIHRLEQEWQVAHDAVYLADSVFPEKPVWLAGGGTFRKYSYAALAFCPFTYDPGSGRLEYHSEIEIGFELTTPEPDGREAYLLDRLMADRVPDARASEIFPNYREIAHLYRPDLRTSPALSDTYDYVIITTGDLLGAITASSFPTWKSAIGYSLRTVLTTDTEITSQPGADLAEKIRNFLRVYYATWGIEYVLLVGDYATVPMRICYPDPDYHVYDPSDPGLVAPGTPTDYYYADLSYPDATSWDSDGDGYLGEFGQDDPDFLAEVAVGRIPVNDSTRIAYALEKLVTFEQDTGAWKDNVLHAGAILFFENQDYSGYPFVDGATCLDSIETGLMSGMSITHFSEQSGLVTSPFAWPAITEAAFTSAWGSGEYAFVNWSGHGWSDRASRTVWAWDDGDGVPEHANGELQGYRFIGIGASNLDDDHPSIVFAISCNVGYPDPNPYGNLGIDLLTLPGWGSSAGIASSSRPAAVAGNWKATGGGTEQICYEFNRYMIAEGEKVGDALYDGKFHATTYYGWEIVYEYMNLYNYNLYGDPSLEVGGATAGLANGAGSAREPGLRLQRAEPNPFTSSTSLRFALSEPQRVRITAHDVTGRQVATLADRMCLPPGFEVVWDGTSESGGRLASGVYFLRVEARQVSATRKLVLLR